MIYITIAFIGIIVAFYFNTFGWLIESWLSNPYYSHGFIVPIISGYIIWNMRKELSEMKKTTSNTGLVVFGIGMILQSIATLFTIRFLSGLSLVVTIFGVILYLYGYQVVKKVSFPILFLLLMIPLPFIDIVAPPIQTISAIGATSIASLLGVPVYREGLLMYIPAGVFEVALECSGLKGIISLLTISAIYAFILKKRTIVKYIIVLSAIPLAIIGNILRIALMLIIANTYGKDMAITYFHELSSILLFGVALVGLFLIGRYAK